MSAPPPNLRWTVDANAAGSRLVDWLSLRFRYHDRAAWEAEVAAGRVHRNGLAATPLDRIATGDVLEHAPQPARAPAEVAVVMDDPAFAVVDKPPHLVCHRVSAFPANTFLPALEARLGTRLEPVHRLDRDTSGVLLLAKDPASFAALQAQFAARTVDKRYVALCHGTAEDTAFTVDAPIGDDGAGAIRDRRVVTPTGKPAVTACTVLQRFAAHTLVAAVPHTGRTHQIRVHLAHRGLPIVGDKLYGRTDAEYLAWTAHLKAGGDPRARTRTLLHAQDLAFTHPRSGERLALHAALPADFARELARLCETAAPPQV